MTDAGHPRVGPHRAGWWVAAVGVAAVLFALLATVRLDVQGLYYDELHQATGAFTYVGSPPELFARLPVGGIPLLNMPYSGALKTAVYGLYMRVTGARFDVISWRLLGVIFAVLGIVAFGMIGRLPLRVLITVLALLVSDVTLLLGVRHDWGPIALSFMLRLIFIAVWLRDDTPTPRSSFVLGALVGVMTFEKLSSCVMLVPLGAVLLGEQRTRQHWAAALAGLCCGALPLACVNGLSLLRDGQLISLSDLGTVPERSWATLRRFVTALPSLAAGSRVRLWMLGSTPPSVIETLESTLLLLGLALAATVALLHCTARQRSRVLVAVASYVGSAAALYALPRSTGPHHWILSTPFQYVALGLVLANPAQRGNGFRRTCAIGLQVIVVALLLTRVGGVISLERALLRGDAGKAWSPELTRLGEFAARRAGEALFIAADWGVATPIYCLSNGRSGLVAEPYWLYRGPDQLVGLQRQSGVSTLYALSLNPPIVKPDTAAQIFQDLASSSHWREAAVEPEIADFHAVVVRKFIYVYPPT